MRRRPWALVILSGLHFVAPLGNIIFNAIILNRNVMNYFVYAMSPQYFTRNWFLFVCPIAAGLAIYACKKWSFYVYALSITALFYFSYTNSMTKFDSIGLLPIIFVYLVNIVVVTYFLIPAVRNVYFDRRMRWWELQSRYKTDFKCNWRELSSTEMIQGKVGNFSENGLFLKSDIHPKDNEKVHIEIPFNQGVHLTFCGEAIMHQRADAIGFGVKFEHTRESRKQAQDLVAHLESKGQRMTNNDVRPEDSFSYWVRTLLTTGKGLVPDKDPKNS